VRTELLTPFIEISPGRTATISVEVYNTGSVIDGVTARAVGIDPAWVELPIEIISLFPDTSERIDLQLTLPRTYPAGRHTIAIEIRSTIDASDASMDRVVLDVAPAEEARLEVTPRRVVGRKKTTLRAAVENRGNRQIELGITAADTVRALQADISPPALVVGPGETSVATIKLQGRRPFFGTPATRQVIVQANGGEHALEQTTSFTQKPVVARGFLTVLILAGIVALWALIFTFVIRNLLDESNELKAVPESFAPGAVDVDGDGVIQNTAAGVEEGPGDKSEIDLASIAGTIKGALTAETTGEGVPRLTVEAYRNTREGPLLVASVASDDSGAYELAGLLPGIYRLRFSGPGFVESWYPAATGIDSAEAQDLPPVGELDLPAVVDGQLGGFEGTVIADQVEGGSPPVVTLTVREPTLDQTFETVASPDGQFFLTGLPTPGNYEITYTSAEFRSRAVIEPLGGGELKLLNTVKLSAAEGSLGGTVTDGTVALGGVTVVLTRGETVLETTTPTSGGGIGTYLFGELETPGTYVITFELEGFTTETQAVDLAPGQARTGFDAVLVGGNGQISGTARDAQGNTLDGVTVTVSGGGFVAQAATLSAGAPGTYTIADIPTPGTYTVTFSLPEFNTETRSVTLASGGPTAGVDVTMARSVGTIQGVVTVGGDPTGGLSVELSDGQTVLSTTTESDTGTYRFNNLAPGSYTVTVVPATGDPFVRLVELAAGETQTADIGL